MISRVLVSRIEHLLAAGLSSHREIARISGVSRGSVGPIARGQHAHQRRSNHTPDAPDELPRPIGRCGICGARCELPCRACDARAAWAASFVRRLADKLNAVLEQPLELELKPQHHARYLAVRPRAAGRRQAGLSANGRTDPLVDRKRPPHEEHPFPDPNADPDPEPVQTVLFDRDPPPWEIDDAA